MKWVERSFRSDLPIGLFPGVVERLRGTPARLDEIIRQLPPEFLTAKVGGGWSIQENIGHLLDLAELDEARLRDYLARTVTLTASDMQNRMTDMANHNGRRVRDILNEFRQSRIEFVHKLENLTEEEISRSALHPRLQQNMRVVDWCCFIAEHDDHHVARISALARVLRDTSEPSAGL
ncbi:MAG TPA: DinB family protein [Bacteroidota bacterium]|nr:DinB family protein [Bacteroidota bacterium]